MNRQKLYIVLGLILVVLGVVLILSSMNRQRPQLEILVAPHDAAIVLDGKSVKAGTYAVKPDNHKIIVTRSGFAAQTKTVSLTKKTTQFVGIILQPDTSETASWYKDHGEDFSLVQTINNRVFDQAGSDAVQANPLLKKLPYIGPGLSYRVDYGLPSENSKTGQPGIYIRYRTEQEKQAALQWIKDQGSDLNSLDIIYVQGNF